MEKTAYLKISNEQDRVTVAAVLLRNGYSVAIARKKKAGKQSEYYVQATLENVLVPEDEEE